MLKQFGVVKQLFWDPLLKNLKITIVFDNFGIQKLDPLMLKQSQVLKQLFWDTILKKYDCVR